MNYFSVLAELGLLLFFSTIFGRRVCDCLPKTLQTNIGFYLSPLLGVAVLVWVARCYGSFFPFQFDHTLFVVLALTLFAMLFEKKPRECIVDWGHVYVFAMICSLPVLAALLHYHGYNPYTDTFTYLAQAQWLQMHAFSEKAISSGYYPYLTQIELYQRTGSRMGGTFLFGFIQSLFHLRWSYDAYLSTMALSFVTGCLAIGGIIKQVISLKRIFILALALLPAFTLNGFVFGAEWGFYPQTLGLAFAAGVSVLFPGLISQFIASSKLRFKQICLHTFPVALCTSALLLAYNEPFPIFAAALLLFMAYVAWAYRSQHRSTRLALFFGVYFVEIVLLINSEAVRIAKNVLQTITVSKGMAEIGWPVLWKPMQFVAHSFGMKSAFNNGIFRLDSIISNWVFPVCFVALCVILVRYLRKRPKLDLTIVFLCCVDLMLFLGFLKFRYFINNASPAEMGHTFLQFKLAKYATPFSLALLGIGLAIIWQDYPKYRSIFARAYVAAVIVGLCFQCLPVTRALHQNFVNETKQYRSPFKAFGKISFSKLVPVRP